MSASTPILAVIAVLFTVLASGCSTPHSYAIQHDETIQVTGIDREGDFESSAYNYSTYAGLQAAADATLLAGRRYFAILKPQYLAGMTINTAEEFIDLCEVNMLSVIVNSDPCNIHLNNHLYTTRMTIRVFVEQPLDVLTYDARAIIDSLKKEGLYEEDNTIAGFGAPS